MKSVVFVCMIVLMIGCAASNNSPAHTPINLGHIVRLHLAADTSFSMQERAMIQKGIEELYTDTNGLVRIDAVYDFDWQDYDSIVRHRFEHALFKIDSNSPIIEALDRKRGVKILAYTTHDEGMPNRVFLVSDRIRPEQFQRVFEHESLHALGAHDLLNSPHALMSITSNETVCLTKDDQKELTASLGLNEDSVITCDNRGEKYQIIH